MGQREAVITADLEPEEVESGEMSGGSNNRTKADGGLAGASTEGDRVREIERDRKRQRGGEGERERERK